MTAEFDNPVSTQNIDAFLKLLMYRSMPAHEDAWLAGFISARANEQIDGNPFEIHAEEFKLWENGWWEGFYEEGYSYKLLSEELDKFLDPEFTTPIGDIDKVHLQNLENNIPKKNLENKNLILNKIIISIVVLGIVAIVVYLA